MVEEKKQKQEQEQMRVHVAPDLEYKYRDVVSVYASPQEVVLEFGNRHRSIQNSLSIGDRIVLSPGNAIRLQQALGQSLNAMQEAIKKQMEESKA